jgi:D-alanyl-D-alanine carboxypeptidase (penicillin-binding protein 5/6)
MWKIRVSNTLAILSIMSVLAMSTLFMYAASGIFKNEEARMNSIDLSVRPTTSSFSSEYFKDITLEAQAAYVYDVNTKKVLYQKNDDIPLPLASITKAMTALVAEETDQNNLTVTIDQNALATDGESGLQEGEKWNLKKLLSFMLISSSNDGAAAVAEALGNSQIRPFVDMMNKKSKELGLDTLSFSNPTGLDVDSTNEVGGYGSAKDVASLFEYTIKNHPDLLEATTYSSKSFSSDSFSHLARNTNTAILDIPNSLASKTGYTLKAGGNLALVFDRGLNEPVIMVVLGSSYDGRFTDIENLASSTLKTYNQSQ